MSGQATARPGLRRAEVIAALSIATDIGMVGAPVEHGLRTCLIAMALRRRLGLDEETAATAYGSGPG